VPVRKQGRLFPKKENPLISFNNKPGIVSEREFVIATMRYAKGGGKLSPPPFFFVNVRVVRLIRSKMN